MKLLHSFSVLFLSIAILSHSYAGDDHFTNPMQVFYATNVAAVDLNKDTAKMSVTLTTSCHKTKSEAEASMADLEKLLSEHAEKIGSKKGATFTQENSDVYTTASNAWAFARPENWNELDNYSMLFKKTCGSPEEKSASVMSDDDRARHMTEKVWATRQSFSFQSTKDISKLAVFKQILNDVLYEDYNEVKDKSYTMTNVTFSINPEVLKAKTEELSSNLEYGSQNTAVTAYESVVNKITGDTNVFSNRTVDFIGKGQEPYLSVNPSLTKEGLIVLNKNFPFTVQYKLKDFGFGTQTTGYSPKVESRSFSVQVQQELPSSDAKEFVSSWSVSTQCGATTKEANENFKETTNLAVTLVERILGEEGFVELLAPRAAQEVQNVKAWRCCT